MPARADAVVEARAPAGDDVVAAVLGVAVGGAKGALLLDWQAVARLRAVPATTQITPIIFRVIAGHRPLGSGFSPGGCTGGWGASASRVQPAAGEGGRSCWVKSYPQLRHCVMPLRTLLPQTGQSRVRGRVTSHSTPRMTSPSAHRTNIRVAPMPVPTLPASQLVSASPVRPEQFLAFEDTPAMIQISMIR